MDPIPTPGTSTPTQGCQADEEHLEINLEETPTASTEVYVGPEEQAETTSAPTPLPGGDRPHGRWTQQTLTFATQAPVNNATPEVGDVTTTENANPPAVAGSHARRPCDDWTRRFPWLIMTTNAAGNPVMKCKECLRHGDASSNTRYGKGGQGAVDIQVGSIRAHEASRAHKRALENKLQAEEVEQRQRSIEAFIQTDAFTRHAVRCLKVSTTIDLALDACVPPPGSSLLSLPLKQDTVVSVSHFSLNPVSALTYNSCIISLSPFPLFPSIAPLSTLPSFPFCPFSPYPLCIQHSLFGREALAAQDGSKKAPDLLIVDAVIRSVAAELGKKHLWHQRAVARFADVLSPIVVLLKEKGHELLEVVTSFKFHFLLYLLADVLDLLNGLNKRFQLRVLNYLEDRVVFGNRQSPRLSRFLDEHVDHEKRMMRYEGVDADGNAIGYSAELHERPLPGQVSPGHLDSCVGLGQLYVRETMMGLRRRLGDLRALVGVNLYRPRFYPARAGEREAQQIMWLRELKDMFHGQLPASARAVGVRSCAEAADSGEPEANGGAGHTGGIEGSVRLAGEQANYPSQRGEEGTKAAGTAAATTQVKVKPLPRPRQKGSRVSREADYSRRVPASPEAEERALRAALSLAEALKAGGSAVRQGEGTEKESEGREGGRGKGKGEAMVKAMVRSHVHGCFWLGLNRSFCTAHLPRSIATLTLKVDPPQGTADPKSNTEADSSQGTSEVTFESTQKSPDSKSSSGGGDSAQGTGESKDSARGVDSSQGTSNSKESTGGKGDTDGEGTRRDVKSDRKRARSRKQEPQEGGSEEGELQQLLGQRRAVMGGVYAVGEGEWRATYLPHKTGLSGGWRGFAMDQELDAGDAVVFEKMDSHTLKVHIFRAADFEEQALEAKSEGREVRQGDPLGPLLFAASIHPCLVDTAAAHPQVVLLAYADDITLLGDATACTAAFVHLTSALAALGLVHNPGKCAAWSAAAIDPSSVPPGISISEEGLQILGSPVGTPRGCAGAVRERLAAAAAPLPLLAQMDPQLSLLLLTRCVSRRASFLARTTPLEALPEAEWSAWGEQLLHTFLDSAHIMSPRSARERWRIWRQAALPVTLGGLGITDPAVESSYAYLTSVISAAHLLHSLEDSLHPAVAALLPRLDPTHGSPHALPARLAAAEAALPPEALEVLQAGKADPKGLKLQQSLALAVHSHRFLRVMREARRMRLNPRSGHAQRMQSVLGPGAGDWLLAIPLIPSLRMGPSQLSTPAAFRLCLPLPVPRRCDCRYRTTFPDDRLPNHLMCCEKGKGRTATHHALRDEIANIGAEAEFTVHKETYVYSLVENLKADVTIRHPLTGEVWMCDVTVTDPVSYQDENCNRAPGWAARAAAAKKKYARRNAWVGFHALAVETYGYPSPGVMAYLRQCAELAAKLRFNAAPTSYEAAKLLTEYRQRWSVCLSNIIYVVLV
ncbi:unnamed protein product [Closterium sp. NIES-53]